jgi:amino acid transporter
VKIPVISIAGILGKKNGDEKKGKKEVTVHSGDMVGKGVGIGLAGSLATTLVLFVVYLFFGSLGSDKNFPELTDPLPIAMMISMAITFICGVILVFMFTSSGASSKSEKKPRLPKGSKLKTAK